MPLSPTLPARILTLEECCSFGSLENDLQLLCQTEARPSHVLVIPAAVETAFYQFNNLPQQLLILAKAIDPQDPDEDDVEEFAEGAQALIRSSYLLDEVIEGLYAKLEPLERTLCVRRLGQAPLKQHQAITKGRPVLLALKALWLEAWSFNALMERLRQKQGIAHEAQHCLIHPATTN